MINFPRWSKFLFKPKRYKSIRGGRGSGKSHTIASALIVIGYQKKCRILCAREFQNSINDSVHKLLSDQITEIGLDDFYTVTANSITGKNGTEFLFKGVRTNVQSIKSMAGITHLWLEEAQTVSKESWDILIPTIREPDSEIWTSWNPLSKEDPAYKMFVDEKGESINNEDIASIEINWDQNPWFPEVLRKEKDYLHRVNPGLAQHVWEGKCRTNLENQLIRGEWFTRYKVIPDQLIRARYAFGDTAHKTGMRNDYSVFELWGEGSDGKIYLLDMVRGKWEAAELKRRAIAFWSKHTADQESMGQLRKFYIEDKASGIGLIQDLKMESRIPITGIARTVDKLTRCMDAQPYIENGSVVLPHDAPFVNDFIAECEAFTSDDTHLHDDQLDPMFDAINVMLSNKNKIKVWERLS